MSLREVWWQEAMARESVAMDTWTILKNIIIIYVQNQPNTGPHIRIVNWSS